MLIHIYTVNGQSRNILYNASSSSWFRQQLQLVSSTAAVGFINSCSWFRQQLQLVSSTDSCYVYNSCVERAVTLFRSLHCGRPYHKKPITKVSLVPRSALFFHSSVCIQYNTWNWKNGCSSASLNIK